MDAKRLVWHTRRPVAEIAHNIGSQLVKLLDSFMFMYVIYDWYVGSWQHVMVFINVVAVISNSFLIAFTSDFGHEIREEYGDEGRLWLLVVFEVSCRSDCLKHCLLFLVVSLFTSMWCLSSCSWLVSLSRMYHRILRMPSEGYMMDLY